MNAAKRYANSWQPKTITNLLLFVLTLCKYINIRGFMFKLLLASGSNPVAETLIHDPKGSRVLFQPPLAPEREKKRS